MKYNLSIALAAAVIAGFTSACALAGEKADPPKKASRARADEASKREDRAEVRRDKTARRGAASPAKESNTVRRRVRPPWSPAAPGD